MARTASAAGAARAAGTARKASGVADAPPVVSRSQRLAGLAHIPVGQLSRALAGALAAGRVSHAYLFAVLDPGLPAPGTGGLDRATAAALSFARRLNCESPDADSACGTCLSCRLVADGNHPDVRIVSPDGLSVKIDQIREMKKEMSLKPRRDVGFRVTIIEGAEKMTVEAQNSFLKLLEEPPDRAVFVLVCQNPSGLLPTVRSRCQMVRVRPADDHDREGGATGDEAHKLVEIVRRVRAMSPLQVLEAAEDIEKALRSSERGDAGGPGGPGGSGGFGGSSGSGDSAGAGGQGGDPRQRLEAALVAAVAWFRDVLVLKATGDVALACVERTSCAGGGAGPTGGETQGMAPGAASGRAAELARDAAVYGTGELMQMIDRIEEARRQVRRNANMRLALEAMLFALKRRRSQARL
ncbi:MAG: DNA polymerase III subunit [Bacillota bacterium]|nr:DNA polymerase III subunit [Bacillota bacterium]